MGGGGWGGRLCALIPTACMHACIVLSSPVCGCCPAFPAACQATSWCAGRPGRPCWPGPRCDHHHLLPTTSASSGAAGVNCTGTWQLYHPLLLPSAHACSGSHAVALTHGGGSGIRVLGGGTGAARPPCLSPLPATRTPACMTMCTLTQFAKCMHLCGVVHAGLPLQSPRHLLPVCQWGSPHILKLQLGGRRGARRAAGYML